MINYNKICVFDFETDGVDADIAIGTKFKTDNKEYIKIQDS